LHGNLRTTACDPPVVAILALTARSCEEHWRDRDRDLLRPPGGLLRRVDAGNRRETCAVRVDDVETLEGCLALTGDGQRLAVRRPRYCDRVLRVGRDRIEERDGSPEGAAEKFDAGLRAALAG
jgi:hypothetical protein